MNKIPEFNYQNNCCPCCSAEGIVPLREVDNFSYFRCRKCNALFIEPSVLGEIDKGLNVRNYDGDYWEMEISAAKERSFGVALARMAEAVLYARIPVHRFVDIGTGPGFFLDAVGRYLPSRFAAFYGVEKFPPPAEYRTSHPNYVVGDLRDMTEYFDAGLCMEVAEHLTPQMMRTLLETIESRTNPGACILFNTGLSDYVLREDPGYLDPVRRGHIVSWTIEALRAIAEGLELDVIPITGKTWAFILEKRCTPGRQAPDIEGDIRLRYYSALPENLNFLVDPEMGSVLKVLGHNTIFAFQ